MAKKDLDWANIGFGYHQTDKRYVDYFHDGAWEGGKLTPCNTPSKFLKG